MNKLKQLMKQMESERLSAVRLLERSEAQVRQAKTFMEYASILQGRAHNHKLEFDRLMEEVNKLKEEQNASDHV